MSETCFCVQISSGLVVRPRQRPQPQSSKLQRTRAVPQCAKSPPLVLGEKLSVWPPVMLSPMAGVTNYPYRRMCKWYGGGLYVSEMIHASSVVEGRDDHRLRFGDDEQPRSAQLLGSDSGQMGAAAAQLIAKHNVAHIDINMGCPVRKVMRAGAGAALTTDANRVRAVVEAVVQEAAPHGVPVTVKMRIGPHWHDITYPAASIAAVAGGAAAITLHARTAVDGYEDGVARSRWAHIKALAEALPVPVIGNGDIFTAADALKMVHSTGCAGVAIGRGCLGRPWFFRDLQSAFLDGWAAETTVPTFGYVMRTVERHLLQNVAWDAKFGGGERAVVRTMRKWYPWYFLGYNGLPAGYVTRLCRANSVADVLEILGEADETKVGYKWKKGIGGKGLLPYPKLPPKHEYQYHDNSKKRGSGSQRGPVTMKGLIQKQLSDMWKEEQKAVETRKRREKARERFNKMRTLEF